MSPGEGACPFKYLKVSLGLFQSLLIRIGHPTCTCQSEIANKTVNAPVCEACVRVRATGGEPSPEKAINQRAGRVADPLGAKPGGWG